MPINTEDIKILKSAVMADVPEGGGAMTGVELIDGQSNNALPDTSTTDRAFGNVDLRKLFGVAHSDDADTLMGAHVMMTQQAADPLVRCVLMSGADWAEERTGAQARIERYLAKGPVLPSINLYDTHYRGSALIQLVSFIGDHFPAGGDCVVLSRYDGVEQFVRLMRPVIRDEFIGMTDSGGNFVVVTARVALYELTSELAHDFDGPPATRGTVDVKYTRVYSTSRASGAKFYGIKPLAQAAAPGDLRVLVSGGINTPLVPSATIETPVVDVAPYALRRATQPTGYAALQADSLTMTVGPGVTLYAPGPISPKSLALTLGAVAFTEVGDGMLLQGSTAVGAVDYSAGTVTFASTAPAYGRVVVSLRCLPATAVDAQPHSQAFTVTSANQGRAFVNAFTPLPAPGTFALDYMSQGRWYQLTDTLYGKLAGADSSYGAGTVNNATGSMAVTLGALPDVDSVLLATYGVAASATAYELATVPAALSAIIETTWDKPVGTLRWTSGGVAKSATTASGDAQLVQLLSTPTGQRWRFTPTVFPDAGVTVDHTVATPHSSTVITPHTVTTPESTGLLNNNNGTFTATDVAGTPMAEGSFSAILTLRNPANAVQPDSVFAVSVYDKAGRIYAVLNTPAGDQTKDLGSIDYATGQIVLSATFQLSMWLRSFTEGTTSWGYSGTYTNAIGLGTVTTGAMDTVRYQIGAPSVTTYTSDNVITYTYAVEAAPVALGGWTLTLPSSPSADATNAAVFGLAGALYTCAACVLRSGWSVQTGQPTAANVGSLSSDGVLSFTVPPAGGALNAVTWYNLTRDVSTDLSVSGVFRTSTSPIKSGAFQLQSGELIGSASDAGALSGDYTGTVDFTRGIVSWQGAAVSATTLAYNAVAVDYLPLDAALLGLETARLPLDGRVPTFRKGDLQIVHHTLTTQLPNPLVKGVAYSLGRARIAALRVKDALGALVPSSLYVSDLDPGTLTVPPASDITAFTQPLTVEHRIEDAVVCTNADISGEIQFASRLTHDFPADTSFVSSALEFGDLFARTYGYIAQNTWTGAWSDALIGDVPSAANYNKGQYPITTTNRGAITERWALIFTSNTAFRIVGESVGDIGTGNTGADCAPPNPATGAAYWRLPVIGLGNSWAVGNVLRFNTAACGAPFWLVRTTLQGPATLASDVAEFAFRADTDRP